MSEHEFKEYQKATIAMIREHGGRLSEKSDEAIEHLYRQWSDIMASANWLSHSEHGIKEFYLWATTAPCDFEEG